MLTICVAAALFGFPTQALNRPGPRVFTVTGTSHGRTFEVVLKQENFQPRGRKIVWAPSYGESAHRPAYLDGWRKRRFWGYKPLSKKVTKNLDVLTLVSKSTELTSLTATVDGKRWPSSGWLYREIHNPDFVSGISASLAKDGKSLILEMSGGEGAGGYLAKWTLRSDGHHIIEVSGSDPGQ